MVGGDDPFYLKFWVNWPCWREIADFEPIIARSASAVTPSEKSSIKTNRKSTTRFPMSLRWSLYIAPKPQKRTQKTQNGRFHVKIALRLKKVCYKVSLYENFRENVVWHSLAELFVQKNIDRGRPLLPEILGQTDRVGTKSPIFDLFSPVAPQP